MNAFFLVMDGVGGIRGFDSMFSSELNIFVILQMTAAASSYVPDYDPLNSATYDPQFTATISNRMQVPDSIHVGGHSKSPLHEVSGSTRANMKVPERIMLAGWHYL